MGININIVTTEIEGEAKYFCTFLSEDFVFENGLTSQVIVGEVDNFDSNKVDFDNTFIANSLFKTTLFEFVQSEMVNDPNLISSAQAQTEGWVYIIDQRTPDPAGEVPPQDIIGAFEVKNGLLNTFSCNENYQIYNRGFTDLGNPINVIFGEYLKKLVIANA